MTELETLRAKLKARDGKPGFEENVQALKKRIAELEAKDAETQA